MAHIIITNMIIMVKKMKNKISLLMVLALVFFCGCKTLPVKDDINNPSVLEETSQDQFDYINKAELVYAQDIEDRGWELKDYRMETGDVLSISVWQVRDLQKIVVVRPDGKISFPLVGDIQAKGVTIEELRNQLEQDLSKYIRVPQVSVIVDAFGGKRAVVIDESGGGGIIRFTEPIRIVEALAMTGGYNVNVNLHKIYVIRGSMAKGEASKIIVVNAHRIFREADMRENILIQADDIVFLARGWLATVTDFVGQMNDLKTQISGVINQANYYRNIDNVVPWNYKATDVDVHPGSATKTDWGLTSE